MTKQRELILQILNQSDRHLTADEVFFLAKLKMPSIAMATIYNNLNAMNEAGIIARVHLDGGADCFERNTEKHDHLICDACGKLTNARIPSMAEHLNASLGFRMESYELMIHYICPDCSRKRG